jgi:hypothetical protein
MVHERWWSDLFVSSPLASAENDGSGLFFDAEINCQHTVLDRVTILFGHSNGCLKSVAMLGGWSVGVFSFPASLISWNCEWARNRISCSVQS